MNQPPYSIGLLGRWGSGKSSIKSMYLSSLFDARDTDPDKDRSRKVIPITFNAWRFGGEEIKRALLRQVYLELGGNKEKLDEALFKHVQRSQPVSHTSWELFKEALGNSGAGLLITALVFVFILGLAAIVGWAFELSGTTVMGAFGTVAVVSAAAVVKFLLDASRPQRHATITQIDAPHTAAEQYEALLIHQLEAFKRSNKKCERIVIFVDDLDRLSSKEMVLGLDAIRTFMEMPTGSNQLGIIFVISCDEDRVAEALFDSKSTNTEMPGAVFNRSDARRYLDRIFQFRLEIPEFPKRDMRNFAMNRLTNDLPTIVTDLLEAEVPLENVIDRMIHVDVTSPRNALQLLNTFSQCWWVAKKREREGAGTDRAGGLQEGAVTKHPIALAALCVLRVDYPDFFHHLVKEPDLIQRFAAVFVRKELLNKQPESTRNVLAEYQDDGELLPKHRPLKQFINSLGGLRWPDSLQPLLLLSQDPITRRHGDKALPLYEAFVSADSEEVFRLLGRDKDGRPLGIADVRLLKDMVEDLERETPVRRDNAAACLAALADRLPEGQAHHLLSPLARRLADSEELRWRLGIPKIRNVLPQATQDDRRDVADRIVADLLLLDGDTTFRHPSGQAPSLEEAVDMARDACSLALWVRTNDGLAPATDQQLLKWLEIRRVAVESKEDSLPFTDFENWVAEHEDSLLPSLKDRYTHLVADQLDADSLTGLDVEPLLARSQNVFGILWDEGEDSREVLWPQLTRFVSVKPSEAVSLAWNEVAKHPEGPNPKELSGFVSAMADRLRKDCEDAETWALDWEAGAKVIVQLAQCRATDLDGSAQESLAALATAWGKYDECATYACDVLDVLVKVESEASNAVIEDWIGRILSDLTRECMKWCADQYESQWTDQQRNQFTKRVNQLVNNDNVPSEDADRYQQVMRDFDAAALKTSTLQSHLTNLCAQIQSRGANPNDYLMRVFPVIPSVIGHCPPAAVGEMLQQVLTETRGNPSLFGWLHGQMTGHWPKPDESFGSYNPQQLCDEATQTAKSSPNADSMDDVLRSVTSMYETQAVGDKAAPVIVETACVIWPHHPDAALNTLTEVEVPPHPEHVAVLMDGIDAEDSESVTRLRQVLSLVANRLDTQARTTVANLILNRQAKGTGENPDLCMSIWIELCSEQQAEILRTLLFSGDTSDENRKRIWLQIEENRTELGQVFFTEVLLEVFRLHECPETLRAALDAQSRINELFQTKDESYMLGKVLLEAFVSTPSKEAQNRLVDWLKSLGVQDVLKELATLGTLSDEDLEVLRTAFPKSRHLKKMKTEKDT